MISSLTLTWMPQRSGGAILWLPQFWFRKRNGNKSLKVEIEGQLLWVKIWEDFSEASFGMIKVETPLYRNLFLVKI